MTKGKHILVTGGSGFLGKRLVDELLDQDCPIIVESITVLDLNTYPYDHPKVSFVSGDIRIPGSFNKISSPIDLIFHCASLVDWGTKSPREVYEVNYTGTQNVVRFCKENNIRNLVYTSSLDTVFSGKDLNDIDESHPYPGKYPNMYCESKYLAEKLILDTNSEELRTCVLRPADIYGEGDIYHIESLINMAKSGFYIRLGDGKSRSQHVYVGNVAYAHLLAGLALLNNNQNVFGQCYFITDSPGKNFFIFFDEIVRRSGYKIWPKNLWISKGLGLALGSISEFIAKILRPIKYYNPKLSRFAVLYTCTNFTFNSNKAIKHLGYRVKYDVNDAIDKTCKYYDGIRNKKSSS